MPPASAAAEPPTPSKARGIAATLLVSAGLATLQVPVVHAAIDGRGPWVAVIAVIAPGLVALPVLGRGALRGSLADPTRVRWLIAAAVLAGIDFELVEVLGSLSGSAPPAGAVFYLTVLVPLAEEWLFRGVLWYAVRAWLPPVAVVVVTAVLFALFHGPGQVVHMPHLVVSGVLLGVLRAGSKSLLPCVFEHGLHNALLIAFGG